MNCLDLTKFLGMNKSAVEVQQGQEMHGTAHLLVRLLIKSREHVICGAFDFERTDVQRATNICTNLAFVDTRTTRPLVIVWTRLDPAVDTQRRLVLDFLQLNCRESGMVMHRAWWCVKLSTCSLVANPGGVAMVVACKRVVLEGRVDSSTRTGHGATFIAGSSDVSMAVATKGRGSRDAWAATSAGEGRILKAVGGGLTVAAMSEAGSSAVGPIGVRIMLTWRGAQLLRFR